MLCVIPSAVLQVLTQLEGQELGARSTWRLWLLVVPLSTLLQDNPVSLYAAEPCWLTAITLARILKASGCRQHNMVVGFWGRGACV
jgi:hypothetical protein